MDLGRRAASVNSGFPGRLRGDAEGEFGFPASHRGVRLDIVRIPRQDLGALERGRNERRNRGGGRTDDGWRLLRRTMLNPLGSKLSGVWRELKYGYFFVYLSLRNACASFSR